MIATNLNLEVVLSCAPSTAKVVYRDAETGKSYELLVENADYVALDGTRVPKGLVVFTRGRELGPHEC